MAIDVILVNPGSRTAQYQGLGAEFSAIETPSLAAMFATYLKFRGLESVIVDQPASGATPEQIADSVSYIHPRLVVLVVYGFQPSASTQNMGAAREVAQAIKNLHPHMKILMTGTHPAALPERTLREEPIDYVCGGEGPQTIAQLVECLKAHAEGIFKVPDLYYWGGAGAGRVVMHNPPAPLLKNLDEEMPSADWSLLDMKAYRAHNWHCFEDIESRQPYASIHTSLGCPFRCSFCCIQAPFVSGQKNSGNTYRMWPAERVGQQLEHLVTRYGVRNVKFVDEMFVLNKEHVLGVCREIERRGLAGALNIWAYARIDTVKGELLDPLRRAGFRWLALGIESASQHVRDGVEKGRFGGEEIIQTVRAVQNSGINVIGNYIFGLPDDTQESMRDTLAMALEANCEFANFYSAMAYPGSKLYTVATEAGWTLPENWSGYSQHSFDTTPLPTQTLTSADVLAFRDFAFREYFSSRRYQEMVVDKFGWPLAQHIRRMLAQPLPRKLLNESAVLTGTA